MITFLIFVSLLSVSAFFSASESGIFSLKSSFTDRLAEKEDLLSKSLLTILNNKKTILVVVLIGNLLANTLLSSVAAEMAINLFDETALTWCIPLITILIIIFCEITPKALALKYSETISLFVAPFILFLSKVLKPISYFTLFISESLMQKITNPNLDKSNNLNKDELSTMIELGQKKGVFNLFEKKLVAQIVAFRDVYAMERMIPRPDIIAAEKNTSRQELLNLIDSSKRSKILIYEQDLDNTIGYIKAKDMLLFENKSICELLRPVLIIPEVKPMDLLLEEMQQKNIKMAVLLDEYATLQGILTLEDVLETIFGELDGSNAKSKKKIRRISEHKFCVSGQLSLKELELLLDLELFKEELEPGENIASYMMGILNKLPNIGDEVVENNFKLEVKKLLKRRIIEVELELFNLEANL